MSYINKSGKDSPKRIKHIEKLHSGINNVSKRAEYGTWKCSICSQIFNTREELQNHNINYHGYSLSLKNDKGEYICGYCNKKFKKIKSLIGHCASCKKHPNKDIHDLAHKKSGETLKRHIKDGTYVISKETREKLSKATINRIYVGNHMYRRKDVKYYDIKNNKGESFKVRGTWELNVAQELNRLNIEWDNRTYLKYKTDITRHYHTDFHLKSSNIFIEVKGFYSEDDKKKMSAVLDCNENIQIYFLHNGYHDFENKNMLLFEACTLLTRDNVF